MLQRAGFFHFANSHCDPLAEFANAIEAASHVVDIAESLIVLPEAFNLGREYGSGDTRNEGPQLDHRCVLASLRTLATMHKAAFIVGVIEVDSRHNSVYFVDSGQPRLMCHKIVDDGYGVYERCKTDCDFENPLNHQETQIGALVCADVVDNRKVQGAPPGAEDAFNRRKHVLSCFVRIPRGLLCVPAYMHLGGKDLAWPEIGLILANSRPGCGSFVMDWKGAKVLEPSNLGKNEVCLKQLSSIIGSHIDPG